MNIAPGNGGSPKKKSKKRLSVERIYQKKTQLEHILLRPDTYIGSVETIKQSMWVYDQDKKAIVNKEISYVPGLLKIFDEILGGYPSQSILVNRGYYTVARIFIFDFIVFTTWQWNSYLQVAL